MNTNDNALFIELCSKMFELLDYADFSNSKTIDREDWNNVSANKIINAYKENFEKLKAKTGRYKVSLCIYDNEEEMVLRRCEYNTEYLDEIASTLRAVSIEMDQLTRERDKDRYELIYTKEHKTNIENTKKIPRYVEPICGNCEYWPTCKSTEGWRINQPCSGIDGVKWEQKKTDEHE